MNDDKEREKLLSSEDRSNENMEEAPEKQDLNKNGTNAISPPPSKKRPKSLNCDLAGNNGKHSHKKDVSKNNSKNPGFGNSFESNYCTKEKIDKCTDCPEQFGVRSYLHNFYESVSIKNPNLYEDIEDERFQYLIAPRKRRRTTVFWKASICLGINMLLFGMVLLCVGYLVPNRQIVVGYQENMEVIDRTALTFNSNLDLAKIIGLVIFCIGGIILSADLLLPSLLNQYCEEDLLHSESFKVTVATEDDAPRSPTEKKIPATEELAIIQPKRLQEEEMVITNAGLCRAP